MSATCLPCQQTYSPLYYAQMFSMQKSPPPPPPPPPGLTVTEPVTVVYLSCEKRYVRRSCMCMVDLTGGGPRLSTRITGKPGLSNGELSWKPFSTLDKTSTVSLITHMRSCLCVCLMCVSQVCVCAHTHEVTCMRQACSCYATIHASYCCYSTIYPSCLYPASASVLYV
jgi:hypothetical protein